MRVDFAAMKDSRASVMLSVHYPERNNPMKKNRLLEICTLLQGMYTGIKFRITPDGLELLMDLDEYPEATRQFETDCAGLKVEEPDAATLVEYGSRKGIRMKYEDGDEDYISPSDV